MDTIQSAKCLIIHFGGNMCRFSPKAKTKNARRRQSSVWVLKSGIRNLTPSSILSIFDNMDGARVRNDSRPDPSMYPKNGRPGYVTIRETPDCAFGKRPTVAQKDAEQISGDKAPKDWISESAIYGLNPTTCLFALDNSDEVWGEYPQPPRRDMP